jgi:transcriptional regulator with XRE-family HTH domain
MITAEGGDSNNFEDLNLSRLMTQAVSLRVERRSRDFSAEPNRARFYSWLAEQTAEAGAGALTLDEQRGLKAVAAGGATMSSSLAVAVAGAGRAGIGTGSIARHMPPAADLVPLSPRSAGPTVQRLVLGGHLRRLREEAGITTERAAASIRGSHSKISRMEHGRVGFKERDIDDLLTLYGVGPGDEREALLSLARGANTPGWWQAYADILPHWVEPYFGLEAAASFIREYELQFVPGLLQIEDYARAVIRLGTMTSEDEVDRRAKARMSRQEILDRENPPKVWAILDEGALRRVIGGPEVMRAQLSHLIDMCDHPAVTLQILPFSAGAHRAMGGPFTILRYTEPDLRDVVYIEQLTSALYLDKPTEVAAYLEVIEEVCLQADPSAKTTSTLKAVLDEI